jgi:hypothetical protein
MNEEIDYTYERVNVTLAANTTQSSTEGSSVFLPEGKVVAIGAIVVGDTQGRIIDLSILNNNNEVVRPCDVRFSEKTSGGTFKDSMRPVAFQSGKTFEARLVALVASTTIDITVQVLFMIQKPITN